MFKLKLYIFTPILLPHQPHSSRHYFCWTLYISAIHVTPKTSVAASPVLKEHEAMTLDVTDLLVTSGINPCWPSDWAARMCHALILECQKKQSWSLDVRVLCPEHSLLGSDGCTKRWQLSGVLSNCAGTYPLKLHWDCVLSVSCLLSTEFSFKLLYLTGKSEFSHTLEFQMKFKSDVIYSFTKAV